MESRTVSKKTVSTCGVTSSSTTPTEAKYLLNALALSIFLVYTLPQLVFIRNSSQSYRASPAVWNHKVLPARNPQMLV